jgi:DNA-binding transcriptional ArsR family regulator
MSAHLTVLSKAGLVEQTKSGRTISYRAVPARVAELTGFLIDTAIGSQVRDDAVGNS